MNNEVYEKLKVMSRLLKEQYGAIHVIVFGSYATGKETEESDIDLLVVSSTDENIIDRMATVRRLLREVKRGLPLSPLVLTPAELSKRKKLGDPFIQNILEEGLAV